MKKVILIVTIVNVLFTTNIKSQFTQGRLVVLRVGAGTSALSNSSTAVFLQEFNPNSAGGASTYTVTVPTATADSLTMSGSATSEGNINLSEDGSLIYLAGYSRTTGVASIAGTTSASAPRAVATVNASGAFSKVATTTSFSGNNIRSAVGSGAGHYAAGATTGQVRVSSGAGTVVSSTVTNSRVLLIYNGDIYFSTGSGTRGIYRVTGKPTNTGNTATNVINTGGSSSPYGFSFSPDGKVCYIADEDNTGGSTVSGIRKWTFDGTNWNLASYRVNATRATGIAVDYTQYNSTTGIGAKIYFTAANVTSANTIRWVWDNGSAGSDTTLVTAAANTVYRGLCFAPSCANAKISAVSQPNLAEKCTVAGWTYYGDSTGSYFAINKNGNTLTATVDVTVSSGAVDSSKSSNGANQEHASYLMKRYWNVNCGGCSLTTNGGVSVRFFYNPSDTVVALTAMRSGFNALKAINTNTLADTTKAMQWIKNNSGTYSPAFFVGNKANGAHTKLTPIYASQNGVSYVQFDTVKSFSGGGGGFGYGPSSGGGGVGLPVTWASFSAESTDGGNKLTWSTASEQNTSHYELEYSIDGIRFITFRDYIPAAGNSASTLYYSYLHSFSAAIVYYRIKQVDLDGQYSYSKMIVVKNHLKPDKNFVSISPSLIQSDRPILVKGLEIGSTHVYISIYNTQGQPVYSEKLPTADGYYNQEIILTHLSHGLYYIRLSDQNLNIIYQSKIRK